MPTHEANNLWRATSRQRLTAPALRGAERAVCVVVGGGIMGAAAARQLACRGTDTVVLEATAFGDGASSRPGGFVVPHFSAGSPDEIEARLGETGQRLVRAVGGSAARVFELVREHDIACDARQGGWYHPAHDARSARRIHALAGQWRRRGVAAEMLDAAATACRTGMRRNHGSWYAPSGGTLHPLDYCLGLLRVAQRHGARLFEASPVLRLERLPGGLRRLRTGTGHIDAERVLVCTNGLDAGLVPGMRTRLFPVRIWQCATRPLAADERERLIRDGGCLSDTRRNLFTYRLDRDGRLITGALDGVGLSPTRAAASMATRLARELGLPRPLAVDYLWQGIAAVSAHRDPVTLRERDGILSASACNGRGIALSTVVGEALALHALGVDAALLPLPLHVTPSRPASCGLQRMGAGVYPHVARALDWWDGLRNARS